jgi:cytidine deaminase
LTEKIKGRDIKMKIDIYIREYNSTEQLTKVEQDLVLAARNAANSSYSPYSGFSVGAAILLEMMK